MKLVVDNPDLRIYEGNAEDWPNNEPIDLVFTNPYGYLPASLQEHPMVIHQWFHRKHEAEEWCGNILEYEISRWNSDREVFWAANIRQTVPINLSRYKPEPGGWYPEELVESILEWYASPGQTVWDGFMGRGTIAKVCRAMNIRYVGVEQLPQHIALAKSYLDLA